MSLLSLRSVDRRTGTPGSSGIRKLSPRISGKLIYQQMELDGCCSRLAGMVAP